MISPRQRCPHDADLPAHYAWRNIHAPYQSFAPCTDTGHHKIWSGYLCQYAGFLPRRGNAAQSHQMTTPTTHSHCSFYQLF